MRSTIQFTNKRNSWRAVFAGLCLAVAAVAGLTVTAQAQQKTILVGGTPSLLYLPFYAALDLGFFTKEGLDVQLVNMPNAIPAMLSGDVQFSLSGSDAAVIAAARGKPTPAVVMFQQRSTLSIVAASSVKLPSNFPDNLKGLKGKTIALNRRGASSENVMKQLFKAAGMEEGRDYSVVIIPTPSSIVLALKSGNIDGAVLWAPFQEQVAVDKIAYTVVRENSAHIPESRSKSGGVSLQANSDFVKSNPEIVKKVINAVVAGTAYVRDYQKNENKLVEIAIKYTGVPNRQAMVEAVKTAAEFAYPGVDCESWDAGAREMFEAKSIPKIPTCAEMTALDLAPKGPISATK